MSSTYDINDGGNIVSPIVTRSMDLVKASHELTSTKIAARPLLLELLHYWEANGHPEPLSSIFNL